METPKEMFRVNWQSAILAETAEDAAHEAARLMRENDNATFTVNHDTASPHSSVAFTVPTGNPVRPARKPFGVCVKLELYYEIDPNTLPDWVDEEGVVKLAEAAFDNVPHNNLPSAFGKDGVLKTNPVEIAISSVESA